jgi:protocatechuate 3,4-dioxygenase beta subunit
MKLFAVLVITLALINEGCMQGQAQQTTLPAPNEAALRNESEYGMTNRISGRVTFLDGKPAANFPVGARFQMHKTGAPGEGYTVTGADGRYELRGLADDRFLVHADNGGKPFVASEPILVDLEKAKTAVGVNFTLEPGPEVTVIVKNAETGKPIPNIPININPKNYGGPESSDHTDSEGVLRKKVGYWEVTVSLGQMQDYECAPGSNLYRALNLQRSKKETVEYLLYDQPNQTVKRMFNGVVLDDRGATVEGAKVVLMRYGERKEAYTDNQGRFSIESFRIKPYEDKVGGLAITATKGLLSTTQFPKAAETWSLIRLTLKKNGTGAITARVADQHGNPIANCRVSAWMFFPVDTGTIQPIECPVTNQKGEFKMDGLIAEAVYQLSFGDWADSRPLGIVKIPGERKYVKVNAGEVTHLGDIAVPTAEYAIQGTIRDTNGKPLTKDVSMVVSGKHTTSHGEIKPNGQFTVSHLVDEPLTLQVFSGHDGGYRIGSDSPDLLLSKAITVKSGAVNLIVKFRPAKP